MLNNSMYDQLFQSFDKAKAFDQLAELYYDRNFASASKSEIDLLMFSFYLDATIQTYKDEQNVLDYVKASDYEMAKQLGITQEKVRNLKVRKQARYPIEFDWIKSLQSIEEYIRVDERGKIIIPVTDPNLKLEIRNFVLKNGGYIEFESGKDNIRIRVEYFLMLMYYIMPDVDKNEFKKELRKQLRKANQDEEAFIPPEKISPKDVLSLVESGLDAVSNVTSVFSPKNTLAAILTKVIQRSIG